MGEYARYNGHSVKIGTCENMYYLRADQRHAVVPEANSVDPVQDKGSIRFRFPWPDEDNIRPGDFSDYDRAVTIPDLAHPDDVEHGDVVFRSSYPTDAFTLSVPCPLSREGKNWADKAGVAPRDVKGLGAVQLVQQKYVRGSWVVVMRCAACGTRYRLETLEDVAPVLAAIDALLSRRTSEDCAKEREFWRVVRERIVAGYVVTP